MNILKKVLVVLLVLIALLFVVSLFLPSTLHVEQSVVVKAPADNAFFLVNKLKNWEKWSPWQKMDTSMKITYSGPEAGVGASYSWVGQPDKTGSGTLTIAESQPGELVVTDLDFGKSGSGSGGFRFEPDGDDTRVTWYMDSKLDGMIDKYMGLMMAGVMGRIFDQGLQDIKTLAESMPVKPKGPDMLIEETQVAGLDYLAVHDSANMENASAKFDSCYAWIHRAIAQQDLQPVGMPFAIYYSVSGGDSTPVSWVMDAGIGVDREGKAAGRVQPGHREAGPAVVAHFFGDYSGLHVAHEALHKYMAEHGQQPSGPPWEEYITDPGTEKDTSRWQTDVYYPL